MTESTDKSQYWNTPEYMAKLPSLPVEYKGSRAEFHDSLWLNFVLVLFVGMPLALTLLSKILPPPAGIVVDSLEILFLPIVIALTLLVTRLKLRHHKSVSARTSATLSHEGIECRGPKQNLTLSWAEIDEVASDTIAIEEATSFPIGH